jgi:hypothetical protein
VVGSSCFHGRFSSMRTCTSFTTRPCWAHPRRSRPARKECAAHRQAVRQQQDSR